MNSESMRTLPCHANIIQRKVKIFSKAAARPLRFSEARIMLCFGTRQDTKSLTSARYLLFPSTSDGTGFSHDKKETFTCFTVKLAS